MFCVGISPVGATEADAPLASDNAPATPKAAVTAFLRPLALEVCLERDMASDLPDWPRTPAQKHKSTCLRLGSEKHIPSWPVGYQLVNPNPASMRLEQTLA